MDKPVFNNKQNPKYSTKDGIRWHSRACAVVVHVWCQYVNVKGETITYVLVGKRGTGGDNIGLLNIPCGYMDWDENLEQASRREVWEETGLNIEKYYDKAAVSNLDQPWFVNSALSENRQNIAMHTAFVFVLNESEGDKMPELTSEYSENNEVEELYWMNIEDVIQSQSSLWAFNHRERVIQFLHLITHTVQNNELEELDEKEDI